MAIREPWTIFAPHSPSVPQGLTGAPYQATAILLQLLLGTVDRAITGVDERLNNLQAVVQNFPETMNLADLSKYWRR